MQPLENKRREVQSGVARAKALLKRDAAWLPGYPMKIIDGDSPGNSRVLWCSATEIVAEKSLVLTLDGEHLRRAQMTITKLRHRFPRALPRIVDDVDDWLRRTDFLLGLLKGAIHHGVSFCADDVLSCDILPQRWTQEVLRIKSAHPSLVGFLDAVTFVALSDRRTWMRETLAWIEQNAEQLDSLYRLQSERPCELPIHFFSVREGLSPTLLKSFVRCLSDPLIRDCQWERIDSSLSDLHRETKKAVGQREFIVPENPISETMGELVRTVFYRICSERPQPRQRAFRFLAAFFTPELMNIVAETQQEVALRERRLLRLLRRIKSGHETIPATKDGRLDWRKKAISGLEIAPEQIATVVALGKCLGGMKQRRDAKTESWVEFLAAFPREHTTLRVRLFARWRHGRYGAKDQESDFNRVLKELSTLLRRRGIAAPVLRHWYGCVDGTHSHEEFVIGTCHELQGNRTLAVRTMRLLEAVAYDRQLDLGHELLTSLVEFAKATDDDNLSCTLIERLAKQPDESYNAIDLRIAILFGESPDEITRILNALQGSCELTELATELKPLADDSAMRKIVATCLAENEVGTLSRMATMACILNDTGQAMPKRELVTQPTGWIDRYPKDYWPVLKSLGAATPDAERVAGSVLGRFFPSPEALQEQVDAIDLRLAAGGASEVDEVRMRCRLENLQCRQTQRVIVSPARRDKLISKLNRRTEREIFERYAVRCQQQVAIAMRQQFDLSGFREDLLAPPLDRVLREINRLNKPMQALGIRLLFETSHRTTRTFDDDPKNAAFCRRMEALGIAMFPWLSDQIKHTAATADGTAYELAFTRDGVDFLLMGFHFDTCLSPNSFNFFSTVANAVDLNKRVVYGKTPAGKVIGRCLFALNDSGEVLTYHRYSHDFKDGFADAVDQFAQRLVSEMGTSIGAGGNVSKLVANEWYDDGPLSIADNWLSEGGMVAKLVNGVSPERFLVDLIEAVGESFLKQRIVDLATDNRVRDRPDLLRSLLDRFGDGMSAREKFIVAVNVVSVDLSHSLLSQLRWSDIVRIVKREQCDQCDVFHGIGEYSKVFRVLTQYHPTLGLRAIRASRPASIQSDLSDPNKTRRHALVMAHEKLGRERLAEKLAGKVE